MNRLKKLTLSGFKTFQALEIEPGALNVLIGANGAGKSNFISFFRLIGWMMASSGNLQVQVSREGGAHKLLHDGPGRTDKIESELTIETDRGTNEYALRLEYAAGDTLIFGDERFRFSRKDRGTTAPWRSLGAGHRESALISLAERNDGTARVLRGLLQRCVVYQFHNTSQTSRMRLKCPLSDNRYLKEDAANVAPVLLRLREDAPLAYRRIVNSLRLIVPFFDDFELNAEHGSLLLAWRETGSDMTFDASQASDGMLRTIALVTLLGQREEDLPSILFLDEPELGLHPYAISIVGGMIERASRYAQVFIATQSVTLIDQFTPEDIIVVERSGRRSTMSRRSTEDLAEWLEEYSLGELWLKNVLGGRPQR
jgi:predicted ATPase